ncbi:MAG TPA: hypothetical protein VLJ16_00730 [Acidobacteriota bacterium]|nr:hypothetical protein [Acidobacteriota bacterium]
MKPSRSCASLILLGLLLQARTLSAFPTIGSESRPRDAVEDTGGLLIEARFDGFLPLPLAVEANAHFPIIYHFEIGADSHPVRIRPFVGEGWLEDRKAAVACLSKWTLLGLDPEDNYVLILEWEHGRGYNFMSLMGDRMSLSIGFPYEALTVHDRFRIRPPFDATLIEPVFLQANASFRIVSQFMAGEDPRPEHVTVLAGEMSVDQNVLKAHLAKAALEGLGPDDFYVLSLDWLHGRGFSRLSLVGSRISLLVRFER